jgi:hypothetical protein
MKAEHTTILKSRLLNKIKIKYIPEKYEDCITRHYPYFRKSLGNRLIYIPYTLDENKDTFFGSYLINSMQNFDTHFSLSHSDLEI